MSGLPYELARMRENGLIKINIRKERQEKTKTLKNDKKEPTKGTFKKSLPPAFWYDNTQYNTTFNKEESTKIPTLSMSSLSRHEIWLIRANI